MPNFPVQQRLNFTLSKEKERAILDREVDRAIKHSQETVGKVFPDGLPHMDKPGTPEERLLRYQKVTYEEDKPLLAINGYIAKFKRGELPPLLSPFWQALVLFPDLYNEMRKDYMRVSGQLYEEEE